MTSRAQLNDGAIVGGWHLMPGIEAEAVPMEPAYGD
jgi:hypothetical protein